MKFSLSLTTPLAVSLLGLASCQQNEPLADTWGALPILDRVEVEYFGTLNTQAADGLEIPEFDALNLSDEELRNTPQWMVQTRMISLKERAVARLLGGSSMLEGDALSGGVVDAQLAEEVIDALIEAGDGTEVNAPRVLVMEGQRGTLTILNQVAYVEHFNFARTPTSLIGDPEIEVFGSGILLDVRPLGYDENELGLLSFSLTWSELLEMSEVEGSFPYGASPVTIQVPVYARQDLKGQLRSDTGQAVLLPVLYGADEQCVLIVVEFMRVFSPETQTIENGLEEAIVPGTDSQ